ncbi:MAG: AMP-binding protein, partial [Spirochaetota bacterium]|nr:AMP-binding protein [Spirochaetota bacterium]
MGVLRSLTMESLLIESTESFGPFECVSFVDGTPYTYRDFYNRVVSLRSYFISRGIKKGDRVALLSENQPNWGVCYFAITTLGAVVVPILTDFHADEIRHILEHSEARAYCVSVKLIEKVRTVLDGSDSPVVCVDNLSVIRVPLGSWKPDKPMSDWELIEISEQPIEKLNFVDEEDWASIIYTSGTTGQSKGVILTHRNIVYDAEAASSIPNLGPGDRLLSILPLAHTYECTIGFITPYRLGSHVFYLSKPPAPIILLPALKKVRPNAMLTVPLLIEKIYRSAVLTKFQKNRLIRVLYKLTPVRKFLNRAAGRKLMRTFGGNIHFFGIGGAALAEDVEKFLREARFPYAIGYGLTETAPLIAGCNAQHTRFRSTGPVLPGVSVKIDNPDKETGEGEILVKGPNVMKGYYKDPEKTAEVLTEDGWFHTGDLGVFDGDEYLYIRGRLKSMILGPSGENIYPEAIEALINEYDFVNESLVVEHEGRLIARVHIDLDAFGEQIRDLAESAGDLSKQIGDYLKQLRKQVNKRLNVFSRVSEFVVEHQPFEKTPTQKIKRYLYTQLGMKNKI